ncbi:MAG: AMP-binding protein [Anaerolineales bacterium]|nr:AMP-binding protein [Anaerolineales bacterium]
MTTLSSLLRAAYLEAPDKVSVILQHANQADQTLTYRDILRGANRYAQTYVREGVQAGEVVVLILQHGADLVHAFWGAILHGAIPSIMPFLSEKLAPEKYRADLASLISITRPSAIVVQPEFESDARGALVAGDSVRRVILTNQIEAESELDFETLAGMKSAPETVAVLQHSSGTTGLQKGVALSHRAVLNQLNAYRQTLRLDERDVIVSWLPLYHDMGFIACFILPILLRVPLVAMSPFDWVRAPYKLLQAVSQHKGTLTWMPNFAYNFCANKIRPRHIEGVDLSSWRAVINCSEPVRVESHELFYEKFSAYGLKQSALQTCYAMAENVFAVTQSSLDETPAVDLIDREIFMTQRRATPPAPDSPSLRLLSCGRSLPNAQVRVADEALNDLPERSVGEILVRSDCMLTEYFHRPDATEAALKGGWYLSGDYGYLAEGQLYVSGRKKDLIIVGGKNVYPQDLEALASQVDGVHKGRVVAFGVFDEEEGTEEVVVVAESAVSDSAAQAALADAIRKHVTQNSAVALRLVSIVGEKWILKTSSGKTARAANKEKYLREREG